METAGKGWEREGSSVPGGHLFTIISERSERAIDHSEVNQGMRVDRLHGVLSAPSLLPNDFKYFIICCVFLLFPRMIGVSRTERKEEEEEDANRDLISFTSGFYG